MILGFLFGALKVIVLLRCLNNPSRVWTFYCSQIMQYESAEVFNGIWTKTFEKAR